MENRSDKNNQEEQQLKYLQQRKAQNLEKLEQRIHEIAIEKQRRERMTNKKEGMA